MSMGSDIPVGDDDNLGPPETNVIPPAPELSIDEKETELHRLDSLSLLLYTFLLVRKERRSSNWPKILSVSNWRSFPDPHSVDHLALQAQEDMVPSRDGTGNYVRAHHR